MADTVSSLSALEAVLQCHSEAQAEESQSYKIRFHEILHGVYPEPKIETLRFTQVDRSEGFRMTNLHSKVIGLLGGLRQKKPLRYYIRRHGIGNAYNFYPRLILPNNAFT